MYSMSNQCLTLAFLFILCFDNMFCTDAVCHSRRRKGGPAIRWPKTKNCNCPGHHQATIYFVIGRSDEVCATTGIKRTCQNFIMFHLLTPLSTTNNPPLFLPIYPLLALWTVRAKGQCRLLWTTFSNPVIRSIKR